MLELNRLEALPTRRQLLTHAAALPLAALPLKDALAQFRVEVSGAGVTQIPIAALTFRNNGQIDQDIVSIVRADLERSGQFRFVEPLPLQLDENSRPDLAPWRERGSDALLTGSVTRLADGRFDVRFRLWDAVRVQDLGGLSFPASARDLRFAAHKVSDYVYEKLTGEKGVFATRISYITKVGGRHILNVADSDGEGAQAAFSSSMPLSSPNWSPNGAQLAYVSFEARKAVIYSHDVATGRRRLLANFRGSNSAPSWSPDGRQVVAALAITGNTQIHVLDANGGAPRRLTQSASIDTEPVYSPDGRSIYFVSDRGGSAQIYRMGAQGDNPQRLTFSGGQNTSPAPSPDGRWLAFISRVGGGDRLHVMELTSGKVTALSDTTADENPSFAPNSRLILYATRVGGREALMTSTVDGRVKTRLATPQGDIREPDWGPFVR
jgi:TolB protein